MTRLLTLTTCALMTTAGVGVAQTPADLSLPTARIAYFDAQRVAAESTTGQSMFAELESFRTEASAEIDERNQALVAEQQRLESQAAILTATARLGLERTIQRSQLDIERLLEDSQAEFLGLQQKLEAGFQVQLEPIVATIVAELDVHFLFERTAVPLVWADPSYDLTDQIIERLDAE